MADLSKLSDKQLLSQIQQSQGSQGNVDLSSMSDEALISQIQSKKESMSGRDLLSADIGKPQSSPLSNVERLRLSFADNKGREKFLRQNFQIVEQLDNGKFAVGDNPNDVVPIDPSGFFNDVIGDLSDIVGEIPVIAGQIGGASLGS